MFKSLFSTAQNISCWVPRWLVLQGKCQGSRRRHRLSSFRPVEDITEEDLENVAITVRDKIYDKVLVNYT